MKNTIKVVELFAGVGGFRLGLEKGNYQVIWSNQWEPSTKKQYASLVYEARFGAKNHSNQNIESVPTADIPDHDLLVGGFPCQDYSVASTLVNSKGLIGKKGVLWWSIHRILKEKEHKPKYLLFENVDRLLKSPASQRGRDFAIMLKSLEKLGYAVEWRVINAADYGMPQRRRRIFFIGYHRSTSAYERLHNSDSSRWLDTEGCLAQAFPIDELNDLTSFKLKGSLVNLSAHFNEHRKESPFLTSGVMIQGKVATGRSVPKFNGKKTVLKDVLQNGEVTDEFFIDDIDKTKWAYLKGAKKEVRVSADGFNYNYSEGAMAFPDTLEKASRTIVTGEGSKAPSRFKHVVASSKGLRRLTPIELERLNMFPDDHTRLEGISNAKRAFFMGNALVVGVVEEIGKALYSQIDSQ